MVYCPSRSGPNWLLRGFVIASALVHLLVALHVSGLFQIEAARRIEVALCNPEQPRARVLPRPRLRPPEPEQAPREVNPLQVPRPLFAQPQMVSEVRPETSAALTGGVAWGDAGLSALPVGDVGPPGEALRASSPRAVYAGDEAAIYQEAVRNKIEHQKRYPASARQRQAEGRVTLRFVISPEGALKGVRVVKSSGHADLNQAALEAVKRAAPFPPPPAVLSRGEIRLELGVSFELMTRGF